MNTYKSRLFTGVTYLDISEFTSEESFFKKNYKQIQLFVEKYQWPTKMRVPLPTADNI